MRWFRTGLLLLMAGIILSMLGDGAAPSSEKEAVELTFISPLPWNDAACGIQRKSRERDVYVKLVSNKTISSDNESRIAEAIRTAVYSDVDGIIVAGAPGDHEIVAAIGLAEEEGVPVVLIDNDLKEVKRKGYIGNDNYTAGQMAGEDMKQAAGERAKIGIIVSTMSRESQKGRVDGFLEAIAGCPQMEVLDIIECNSNKMMILEKLDQMLQNHPEMDALFLAEGCSSDVVGELIRTGQLEERKIVGFDGANVLDYVEEGIYISALRSDNAQMAETAVEMLCDLQSGTETQERVVDVWHATKENVAEVKKQEDMGKEGEFLWQFY